MAPKLHLPLDFPPGIQRDGTRVDSASATDGLWCRWRGGRPRKIPGFNLITGILAGIPRTIHMFYKGSQTIIHIGTSRSLEQVVIDANGDFVSHADRTPTTFTGGLQVGWTLDAIFDTTSDAVQLVAHSVPNLNVRADTVKTTPFIGKIDATTPLVAFPPPLDVAGGVYTLPRIAGGIVCVQPYVFDFDSEGMIGWSAPNLPSDLGIVGGTSGAGGARVSAQKIMAGRPIRGGGTNSPAALFWSLSEVISASFVGQDNGIFAFNTVSPSSSILSGASVIEYDSLYFWAGVDRFLVYNGTVVEIENKQNQDWFFNNINREQAGKSFAFKVPHFGEIWFCAPLFGNTEPSHAAIFNVREKCWYDTELPNGGRTAGYFAQGFPFPVMSSPVSGDDGYKLWLHEKGTDQTGDGAPVAIRSYFETPFIGGPMRQQPDDKGFSFDVFEPDIAFTGDLSVYVIGGANPRSSESAGVTAILKGIPATPQQQFAGFKETHRLGRLHVESNCLGGNYVVGRSIIHGTDSQATILGGTGNPLTGQP